MTDIRAILHHLQGAYDVHDDDDGAEYRDGFNQALREVAELASEWEPCDAPTGEHDDGDPLLCRLPSDHDGDHDHGEGWIAAEPGVSPCDGPGRLMFRCMGCAQADLARPVHAAPAEPGATEGKP